MASTARPTISASTQHRILIWRTEVASALDDASSCAASSTGTNLSPSLSDTNSSGFETTAFSHVHLSRASRGRRFIRRLARRLSGGRFGGQDVDDENEWAHGERTAMYRAPPPPPPPVDASGMKAGEAAEAADDDGDAEEEVGLGEESSDGIQQGRSGLKEKQERLERAARLLELQTGV